MKTICGQARLAKAEWNKVDNISYTGWLKNIVHPPL